MPPQLPGSPDKSRCPAKDRLRAQVRHKAITEHRREAIKSTPGNRMAQGPAHSSKRKITCMHVEASYERNSRWEQHQSTFRVYFFEEPGPGYSVSTFDLTDATLSEAKTWAEDEAGDRMYSIALVSSNEQGHRGLIWLIGDDANDVLDQAPTEVRQRVQSRLRQEMIENRSRRN